MAPASSGHPLEEGGWPGQVVDLLDLLEEAEHLEVDP